MEFAKSRRGKDVLLFNGFKFTYNKKKDEKTYWRCATLGCKASSITVGAEMVKVSFFCFFWSDLYP